MTEPFPSPADRQAAAEDKLPEIQDSSIQADLAYTAKLIGRYLKADPRYGTLLVAFVAATTILSSYAGLQFQIYMATSTNALATKNVAAFWGALGPAAAMVFGMVLILLIETVSRFYLRIRWRATYVADALKRWLHGNNFYHFERSGKIDHPEQRIQEDSFIFAEMLLQLAPPLLGSASTILVYWAKLAELSPAVSLKAIGLDYTISGYLPFIAFVSGILMTIIVHKVGDPMRRAEITRQRLEAQFRHEIGTIRENAEAIAFEKGAEVEKLRLSETFELIRQNWRRLTFANARVDAILSLPGTLLLLLPLVMCAPLVFKGRLGVGDVQLISGAFVTVYGSVAVIASVYPMIATFRSAVGRMRYFEKVLDNPQQAEIEIVEAGDERVEASDLTLNLPDGQMLVSIGSLSLRPGQRLLVQGRSGVGKSTMLRALAGLWPHGGGRVRLPRGKRIAFLPQRSYMPEGTLAGLLSYPEPPNPASDAQYCVLLGALGLDPLVPRLHEYANWRHILSPGQQQRIAAIRILLAKPDFLFLDEATSALDLRSEAILYALLDEQLPYCAIISVAHRPGVAKFHSEFLTMEDCKALLS